jgi:hypothetical protein
MYIRLLIKINLMSSVVIHTPSIYFPFVENLRVETTLLPISLVAGGEKGAMQREENRENFEKKKENNIKLIKKRCIHLSSYISIQTF